MDVQWAYSNDLFSNRRRAAVSVDGIRRVAKPSDLAIMQRTEMESAISPEAAKALGLTIAQALPARANEVGQ